MRPHEGGDEADGGNVLGLLGFGWEPAPAAFQAVCPDHCRETETEWGESRARGREGKAPSFPRAPVQGLETVAPHAGRTGSELQAETPQAQSWSV